jgi:hypothetical protein
MCIGCQPLDGAAREVYDGEIPSQIDQVSQRRGGATLVTSQVTAPGALPCASANVL